MPTTRLTFRHVIGAAVVVFAAVIAVLLLNADGAEAAPECCDTSYSKDGKTMYITGYVSYRGKLLYMSVGGQKCLARAGKNRAYIKSTIPTKLMPNGRHEISIVSKVNGEVRYSTQYFTISDSPAVAVDIGVPDDEFVRTSSPTIEVDERGAVKSRACTLDGSAIGCSGSDVKLSDVSDGRHVFTVTVRGSEGFSASAKRAFTIDTLPPTPPDVPGGEGEWTMEEVTLRATGSTDEGAGVKGYQWQRSTDGGSTWGRMQRGRETTVFAEGETHFRFRAVDGAGRASEWVDAVARIDLTAPTGMAALAVTAGDPCSEAYPVTLTASGGEDELSGIEGYHFMVFEQGEGASTNRSETGTSLTLEAPGAYYVVVWLVDAAGNQSSEGSEWSNWDGCPQT